MGARPCAPPGAGSGVYPGARNDSCISAHFVITGTQHTRLGINYAQDAPDPCTIASVPGKCQSMNADRLKKLREKKAAIDAQIRDLSARDRQQQRKDETRRKIILGAFALEHLEKNKTSPFAKTLLPLLDEYVSRQYDRDLLNARLVPLGLAPLPPLPEQPANDDKTDSLKSDFKQKPE